MEIPFPCQPALAPLATLRAAHPPGHAPHSRAPRIVVGPLRADQRCADWPRERLAPTVGRDAPEGGACWGPTETGFSEA